jgi:SAM-dependent methyltransferase
VTAALFGAGRFFARAQTVFNHLAAGTLSVADLRTGTTYLWERDEARDDAVAAGLMPWEEDLVSRFLRPQSSVLLVGSGPGRDLIALVAQGYKVTGVEPAARALTTARKHLERRGLSADLIEGYFEDVDVAKVFDVIIFSYCCYSFIPESARRIDVLRKAAAHLGEGGRVIISYMVHRSGHPALMQLARLTAAITGSGWHPERGDALQSLDAARPLFYYEHSFQPGEIEAEAAAAGFAVTDRFDIADNPVVVLTPNP